jgi:hypothetical protein
MVRTGAITKADLHVDRSEGPERAQTNGCCNMQEGLKTVGKRSFDGSPYVCPVIILID